MTENEFADGDGDEPEIEVIPEVHENDICTWTDDPEEKRRAFVANLIADPDIDGGALIQKMHAVCEWIKTGKLPNNHLRVVGGNSAGSKKNPV